MYHVFKVPLVLDLHLRVSWLTSLLHLSLSTRNAYQSKPLSAGAIREGGAKLETLVPMPPEAKTILEGALSEHKEPGWPEESLIINHPEDDQRLVSRVILEYLSWQGSSHMVMQLVIDETALGAPILNRSGPLKFAFHDSTGQEDVHELPEASFRDQETLLLDQ